MTHRSKRCFACSDLFYKSRPAHFAASLLRKAKRFTEVRTGSTLFTRIFINEENSGMVVQKTTMQLFAFSKHRRSAALLSGYPEPDKQADPHGKGHGARLLERPLSPLLKSVKERECNSKKQNRQGSLPRGISLCDADDGQYLGNSSYPLQRIASRFRLYLFVPRIFTGSFVMVFHIAAP